MLNFRHLNACYLQSSNQCAIARCECLPLTAFRCQASPRSGILASLKRHIAQTCAHRNNHSVHDKTLKRVYESELNSGMLWGAMWSGAVSSSWLMLVLYRKVWHAEERLNSMPPAPVRHTLSYIIIHYHWFNAAELCQEHGNWCRRFKDVCSQAQWLRFFGPPSYGVTTTLISHP